jgi:Uma2 family endonuclease
MVAGTTTHKFTVEAYHEMAEVGILGKDDRVELIEGEIVEMPAIGNRHFAAVNRLNECFHGLWADKLAIVSIQGHLQLGPHSEPQPDVALLHYIDSHYEDRRPQAEDAYLVVEVGDSSIVYDSITKVRLYAAAGVPELWIVDLTQDQIEVYRGLSEGRYTERAPSARGQQVSPMAFPDLSIRVEDIIGP